jgi:hypothetical protein
VNHVFNQANVHSANSRALALLVSLLVMLSSLGESGPRESLPLITSPPSEVPPAHPMSSTKKPKQDQTLEYTLQL